MSTKTNKFKRIALVAVAGLGLGLFTSVPSQAAPTFAYTSMYDTTNGVQVTGGIAKVTVTIDTGVQTRIAVTGVGSVISSTNDSASANNITVVGTPTSGTWTDSSTSDYGHDVITLSSAVAGVTTITATPLSSAGVPGTAVTKTVTWTPSGTLAVASATAKLNDTQTAVANAKTAAYADQIDTNVSLNLAALDGTFAAANTTNNLAYVSAKFVDGNGAAVSGATVVVSVSGPGILSASSSNTETATSTSGSATRAFICTTGAGGTCSTAIKADGTAGTSTITFTSGKVSVSKSVTFFGAPASFTLLPLKNSYLVGTALTSVSTDLPVRATVKDANGAVVVGFTPYIISNDTTKLTAAGACSSSANITGRSYCGFTPLVKGTLDFTIANASTLAAATVTAAGKVVAGLGVATKVEMKFDQKEYAPGQAGELVFTLTDKDGDPVADGDYALASSAAYGVYFTGQFMSNPTGGSTGYGTNLADATTAYYANNIATITTGGGQGAGKAFYPFYAPQNAGTLTADGVTRTSGTSKLSGAALGATLSSSAKVTSGQVGADAAAALQAVTALASQVNAFITKINAQITTLTDLVMKIQKKVKA